MSSVIIRAMCFQLINPKYQAYAQARHVPCLNMLLPLLLLCILQVRLMAAEAALSAGEVGVATHLCLQLAAVRYGPAWHLAAELACPQR